MTLHLRAGRALRNVPAHHGVDLRRAAAKNDTTAPSSAGAPSSPEHEPWEIPVLQTVACEEKGITEVADALDRHFAWLEASGERSRRRRARLTARVRAETDRSLRRHVWHDLGGQRILDEAGDALERGDQSPYEVAARIVDAVAVGSARGAQG